MRKDATLSDARIAAGNALVASATETLWDAEAGRYKRA